MSIDEPRNHVHAAMAESDEHPAWTPRRQPVNRGDELDLRKQQLAEEIHILRDALAVAEAEYVRLDAVEVDHDPDPGFVTRRPAIDPRMFDLGTDEREAWVPVEAALPRSVVSVDTRGKT